LKSRCFAAIFRGERLGSKLNLEKNTTVVLSWRGMGLFQNFKAFISRGNVVDLAVGVIVGGAFGKIVSSLVADVG
jgi:hypothetical protein